MTVDVRLLLALTLLVLTAAPAAAAVEVRSTTTISGTSTGWVDVRVPEGVTIAMGSETAAPPSGLTIERPGDRLGAVMLQRFDRLGDQTARRLLLAVRHPDDHLVTGQFAYTTTLDAAIPPVGTLRAGDYRLHLFTEPGVRTTAAITFEGAPEGRLELEPVRPMPDLAVVRPSNGLAGTGGLLLSGRASRRPPEGGAIAMASVALRGRAPSLWRTSACIYDDDGSLPEAKAPPTCTPARVTTLLAGSGGSGGNPGTVFVPAGVTEDSWTRSTVLGGANLVSTLTVSAQTPGPPPRAFPLLAWFDSGPLPAG